MALRPNPWPALPTPPPFVLPEDRPPLEAFNTALGVSHSQGSSTFAVTIAWSPSIAPVGPGG
jgi:hypothetical protein